MLLLRPDDLPGPAGAFYQSWQRAAEPPISAKSLIRALPKLEPIQDATWLNAGQGMAITRGTQGLKDIFGKEISRDLIDRLHERNLIGTGPPAPRRGASYTYVTTDQFLLAFDLESLGDLPDQEQK